MEVLYTLIPLNHVARINEGNIYQNECCHSGIEPEVLCYCNVCPVSE